MDEFAKFFSTAEFWKFMGALAVIIAAIWTNPMVNNKLKDIKLNVQNKLHDIEDEITKIKSKLGIIEKALKENTELTAMTKTRRETIESLTLVVNNALEYIGDVELREFIQRKAQSIIQFNVDLFELDLDCITDLQIKTKIGSEKNNISKIGCGILGKEFINGFYQSIHGESTDWYERDILNILHCKINYKQDAIRARTEVFIRESIRALVTEYDIYKRKK